MKSFVLNPVNLMRTLTLSLDLAVNGINMHQQHTAIICWYIADAMELDLAQQQTLLIAALMHDIGAAPDMDERSILLSPDRDTRLDYDIHIHGEKGYHLLRDSVCFADAAIPVRYHHDSWSGGNPSGLRGDAIPLASRIIHLSDVAEMHIDKNSPVLPQRAGIQEIIRAGSGKQFDPGVVDAFMDCSRKECFWLDQVNSYMPPFLERMNWGVAHFTPRDVLNIAEMFATLIDRTSVSTATHSRSVSRVAVLLAARQGFCETELYMMRVAGLLHDLGKLSVPSAILEKPGNLNADEVQIIRQHTYHTYRILSQIENWQSIAEWAAFHHETLDGKGYPFKIRGAGIPLGSRIMAVADIFVALTEDRPYRKGMNREKAERIMVGMVKAGKIDARLVDSLFDMYDEARATMLESVPEKGKPNAGARRLAPAYAAAPSAGTGRSYQGDALL